VPRNKLFKEAKDLYHENYTIVKKKMKKMLENRKISHIHGFSELIL
jgi:hypothetical protein